ncbi:hypothetical protein [Haloarchaeobius sp. DFWS5]|uniref:hypothetical protein n=1 Tax=Haloarchaeobius sp. DFWS5 TaxID=3446114 RepID=UPI003EC0278C
MHWSRRQVLASVLGGGTLVLSGCNTGATQDDENTPSTAASPTDSTTTDTVETTSPDWHVRPDTEPTAVETGSCQNEEFKRMNSWVDDSVAWGDVSVDGTPVFALRVESLSHGFGDTVRIELRNVSDETRDIGNKHKSNLSLFTEDGWREVRGFSTGTVQPITDGAHPIEPGEPVEWVFPFSAAGIVEMSYPSHRDDLTVCPALRQGRYRFATGATPTGVAVGFDVTE